MQWDQGLFVAWHLRSLMHALMTINDLILKRFINSGNGHRHCVMLINECFVLQSRGPILSVMLAGLRSARWNLTTAKSDSRIQLCVRILFMTMGLRWRMFWISVSVQTLIWSEEKERWWMCYDTWLNVVELCASQINSDRFDDNLLF